MSMRRILIDPDGTQGNNWLYVIVEGTTGVVYESQCAGTTNEAREAEGFLVPVTGAKLDAAEGSVDPMQLRAVFHNGTNCCSDGMLLCNQKLRTLEHLISTIPYWSRTKRGCLELDHSRLDELVEAWVPVITADGPGILVWNNCD